METKSCRNCKGLYQSAGRAELCPRCIVNNDESFKYIKEYLEKHPGTALPILSEKTGVSIAEIERYLREERIEVAPDSPVMLACTKCGAEIVTGLYCNKCSRVLAGELQKIKNTLLANEKDEKEAFVGKMHYVPAKWTRK